MKDRPKKDTRKLGKQKNACKISMALVGMAMVSEIHPEL